MPSGPHFNFSQNIFLLFQVIQIHLIYISVNINKSFAVIVKCLIKIMLLCRQSLHWIKFILKVKSHAILNFSFFVGYITCFIQLTCPEQKNM